MAKIMLIFDDEVASYSAEQICKDNNIDYQKVVVDEDDNKGVALYHRISFDDSFDDAAQALFKLVKIAQKQFPNKPRYLYFDIDGHKNKVGGFDKDMFELQKEFSFGFLMQYLTELHTPLGGAANPKGQCNDVPDVLQISKP